jgi:hypothetical protein
MILLWISLNSLLFDHLINQIKLQIVKPILRGQRWYTINLALHPYAVKLAHAVTFIKRPHFSFPGIENFI